MELSPRVRSDAFYLLLVAIIIVLLFSYLLFENRFFSVTVPTVSPTALPVVVKPSPATVTYPEQTELPDQTTRATSRPSLSLTSQTNFNLRVMLVGYNPAENGTSIADKYFKDKMGNISAKEYEQKVFEDTALQFKKLSEGSISYTLGHYLNVSRFQTYPDSFSYTVDSFSSCVFGNPDFSPEACEKRKWAFDYVRWTRENKVCELAEKYNIDEIWMLSPSYVTAYESFMIGPTRGFDVNGNDYIVPNCKRHYIVLNGTYDRPDTVMHSYSHKVESVMDKVTESWSATDRDKYYDQFIALSLYTANSTKPKIYCGNGHYPSNSRVAYDYANMSQSYSRCADWKLFPQVQGTTTLVDCQDWGCTDTGWQSYWLGSLPRSPGVTTLQDRNGNGIEVYNNWWKYILYPESVLAAL